MKPFVCRVATRDDLERIWDKSIADNPGDDRYIRWKQTFIADNEAGRAVTFVVLHGEEPVGEGTLILSTECRAVRGRPALANGREVANVNALRIDRRFEGQGHISALMRTLERYAEAHGITRLTIGVEAAEARNLSIYLHWGYRTLVHHETDEGALVLYYEKTLS